MYRTLVTAVGILATLFQLGCQATPARPNAALGGLLGGISGSIVGAGIGSHEGKAKEGALIGAVTGGLAGSAIGNQTDQANMAHQAYRNRQQEIALESAVTMDQVVQMATSGLSDAIIINQIQVNGVVEPPTTANLINLKNNGVSDQVIREIQMMGSRSFARAGFSPVPMPMNPVAHQRLPRHFPKANQVYHPPIPVVRRPRGRRGFGIDIDF